LNLIDKHNLRGDSFCLALITHVFVIIKKEKIVGTRVHTLQLCFDDYDSHEVIRYQSSSNVYVFQVQSIFCFTLSQKEAVQVSRSLNYGIQVRTTV